MGAAPIALAKNLIESELNGAESEPNQNLNLTEAEPKPNRSRAETEPKSNRDWLTETVAETAI